MSLPPLPEPLSFAAGLLLAPVLAQAARRAPWRALHANRLERVYAGALVAVLLLWSFQAGVRPGLDFHFLGVTVLTLMFGWSLATLGTAVVGVALCAAGRGGDWEALPLAILLGGALPAALSHAVQRFVTTRLPHNPFVYIFLCGFVGAILAAGAMVAAQVALLAAANAYPFARIAGEYLPFLPLYLFPEGVLNGMLTTVLIGLRPGWLKTFDENTYLKS